MHIPHTERKWKEGRQAEDLVSKADRHTDIKECSSLGYAWPVWDMPGLSKVKPAGNHLRFRQSETHKTRAS